MNASKSPLLPVLPISSISDIITSLCSRLHCISHLFFQSKAGNSILLFNKLFTKTGGEFKTLKTYASCTEQVILMWLVSDSLHFYACAHNSSRAAGNTLCSFHACWVRECEFWAGQQRFIRWLHIGALILDGGKVANQSLPWLTLIRAVFLRELGRCLQGLKDSR